MSTLLRASTAAALLSIIATPVMGQAVPGNEPVFATSALSADELSEVRGQGTPRGAFWRDSMREQVTSYDQQNSALTRVTFDNWFVDVGGPLIWSNVIAGR